jgi:hypothetical protein
LISHPQTKSKHEAAVPVRGRPPTFGALLPERHSALFHRGFKRSEDSVADAWMPLEKLFGLPIQALEGPVAGRSDCSERFAADLEDENRLSFEPRGGGFSAGFLPLLRFVLG